MIAVSDRIKKDETDELLPQLLLCLQASRHHNENISVSNSTCRPGQLAVQEQRGGLAGRPGSPAVPPGAGRRSCGQVAAKCDPRHAAHLGHKLARPPPHADPAGHLQGSGLLARGCLYPASESVCSKAEVKDQFAVQ